MSKTPALQALTLQLDQIIPNPGNVRRDLALDDAFVASIKENGVRVPLVVVPAEDGRYELRYGHRRFGAAQKASRATVPALVLDPALREAGEDWVDQLIENEDAYRRGLTELEKADALFGALDAGMSTAKVAKRTGLTKDQVTRASSAAKGIGERTRTTLDQAAYTVDLDQLAILAEFDDDPDAVSRIMQHTGSRHWFMHQARIERQEREITTVRTARAAVLKEAGIRLWENQENLPPNAIGLEEFLTEEGGRHLTEEEHQGCPGHCVTWEEDGDEWDATFPLCLDPAANGHHVVTVDDTSEAATPAKSETGLPRAAKVAGTKAYRVATDGRRDWLTELLGRKTAPKPLALWVTQQLLDCPAPVEKWSGDLTTTKIAAQLLGKSPDTPRAQWLSGSATPARLSLTQFAVLAACYERRIEPAHTWRPDNPQWDTPNRREDARAYLTFLAELGYEPTPIEAAIISGTDYTDTDAS
ncbi:MULTISPECIES: ParB/RepB/Spo0J family partition protein [unclassified Streptomyces]|uniref:ParB/RepB/Spo0J family partition protein n=1 Tax=unclassified Streptomyces TaxID=2593676 RepID=UPI000DC53A5C|nr:ParB/RepB/Spo0J family partition protein [Streptomyces sp. PsTaAH-137]MYT71186.1 ParB/RepB/Spo0J family partition protein [Streptomyces sp. SID8367]RAJ69595.1 ParB family chromosome partitioning protein [Streptomyces sp. PsTaAH-137]